MTFETNLKSLTRRAFLRNIALGAAGVALLSTDAFAQVDNPYAPFQMAIQSYTLRGYKLDEALAKTKTLGLKYWEGWDGHLPMTQDPNIIADYKGKLKANGITMLAYGVIPFSNDEADARRKFEFGKALGIRTFSASPSADAFNLLDKLVEEYKINIAIHNHGPGDDLYDKWEKVLAAIQGHNPRIGVCLDTGHLLRSDERPEVAATKYGKRLFDVHFKDVIVDGNKKEFTEIGKGTLDPNIMMRTLIDIGFPKRGLLSLEYELHEQDPMPYVEECLKKTRDIAAYITKK
ncbi:MAG TPA: sugar phosphate isomerase/epimerase [Chthonomonadaceae bacterium]|nr:sugar phosphate isomerase/epimerase [Chthonomonadaceae bacterium]